MNPPPGDLLLAEAPAKFSAPGLESGRLLPRLEKLEKVALRWGPRRPVLRIEAQAGQGKSVFVAQLLVHVGLRAGWFQVGEEDRDPIGLAAAVVALLRQSLPGFRAPVLEERLVRGEVAVDDLGEVAAALAARVRAHLRGEFCLVFDDLHLLEGSPASLAFLAGLAGAEVPGLRFAFLSRRPVSRRLVRPGQTLSVSSAHLRFSRREVAELFHRVFEEPLTVPAVAALHRVTEGWVMGLLLLRGAGNRAWEEGGTISAASGAALEYFVANVLDGLPAKTRRGLLRLSLLKTVPVDLARVVGGGDGALLEELEARNLFVRSAAEDRSEYLFHHLFRECLRHAAVEGLGAQGVREVLAAAGAWYRERGRPEEALDCLVQAGEHGQAERLLREVGFELLGRQRAATLKALLDRLPRSVLLGSPWLAFFAGLANLAVASAEGVPLLRGAADGFEAAGDQVGELLCLAHLLYFRVLLVADFEGARPVLERAVALFDRVSAGLDPVARVHAAHMIATAEAFVNGDVAAAERYSTLALGWAGEADQVNLAAGVRVARLSAAILAGSRRVLPDEAEHAGRLLRHPRVSLVFRSTLAGLLVNRLLVDGDEVNYRHHRERIGRVFGEQWLEARLVGPLLRLWDTHRAVVAGRWEEAEALALGRSVPPGWAENPHLESMFLQYAAVVHAARGRDQEARAAAETSAARRRRAGGRFFRAQNDLFVGASLALLGDREAAEQSLGECLAACQAMGQESMAAAARCHRVALRLGAGDRSGALDDLPALLEAIGAGVHPLSYGAWPSVLEAALSAAMATGLEPGTCRRAAVGLLGAALAPDGSRLPLVRIRTLGGLRLAREGGGGVGLADLSETQRRLLGVLLGSENLAATQAEVQLALWPESSPERARASFNTTLSRLRRTLDEGLGGAAAADLLPLRNGVLRLVNCRVDAQDLHRQAETGLAHARRGEDWAAANRLRAAERLWRGPFLRGLVLDGGAEHYRHRTLLRYLETARELAPLLAEEGDGEEGIRVAERALVEAPVEASLVRTLHSLQVRQGRAPEAQDTVDRYARALAATGFRRDQVEAAVEALWGAAGSGAFSTGGSRM